MADKFPRLDALRAMRERNFEAAKAKEAELERAQKSAPVPKHGLEVGRATAKKKRSGR